MPNAQPWKGDWGASNDPNYQEHQSPKVYPDAVIDGGGPAGDTKWSKPDDLGLENEPGFNKTDQTLDGDNTNKTPFPKDRHTRQDMAGFDPDMTETHTSYGRPVMEAAYVPVRTEPFTEYPEDLRESLPKEDQQFFHPRSAAEIKEWLKSLPRSMNVIRVFDQIQMWMRQGIVSPKQMHDLQVWYTTTAKIAVVTDPKAGIRSQAQLFWNNGSFVKFPHRKGLMKMTPAMQKTAVVFGQTEFDLLGKSYPVVTVQWKDIFFTSGESLNDPKALDPVIFYTTGILIKNDPDGVVLLMELDQEDVTNTGEREPGSTFQYIPRGVITKIHTHGEFKMADFVDASVAPMQQVLVVKFTKKKNPTLALFKAGILTQAMSRDRAAAELLTPAVVKSHDKLYAAYSQMHRLGSSWLASQIQANEQVALEALSLQKQRIFINSMKVADIVKEPTAYWSPGADQEVANGTAPNAPSMLGREDQLKDFINEVAPTDRKQRSPNNNPGFQPPKSNFPEPIKSTGTLTSEDIANLSVQKLKQGLLWWTSMLEGPTRMDEEERENLRENILNAKRELASREKTTASIKVGWSSTDGDDAKRESRPKDPDFNMTEQIDQYDGPELPSDPFIGAPREGDTASADSSAMMDSFNFGQPDSRAVPPDVGMNAPYQKNKPKVSQTDGYYSRGNQ